MMIIRKYCTVKMSTSCEALPPMRFASGRTKMLAAIASATPVAMARTIPIEEMVSASA